MFSMDQLLGFQSFFNVLTQISPFSEILGWNIFVKNTPFIIFFFYILNEGPFEKYL